MIEYCPYHPDEIIDGEVLDPYAEEIHGVEVMMPNCRKCYYEAMQDI